MAYKIIWSLQARDDLREIVTFIAADNPAVAEAFGFRLMSKADMLATFPLIGRVVPEQPDENIREIILRPYRIIYQVFPQTSCSLSRTVVTNHANNSAVGAAYL